MNETQKQEILIKAKNFFRDILATRHIANTEKLTKLKEFNVNPFLIIYLSNYLSGNHEPESIAKALIYPRVLGTSINTSFGQNIQTFCSSVLSGFASLVSGIDIEFVDTIDGRKKYCQIKAGPNTINKDDVETINNHFQAAKNLARTNQADIRYNDLIVGVLYGEPKELSTHYKKIAKDYPVIVGKEFWYRLTGDHDFYIDLTKAFGEVAIEADSTELLQEVIQELASEIKESDIFKQIY